MARTRPYPLRQTHENLGDVKPHASTLDLRHVTEAKKGSKSAWSHSLLEGCLVESSCLRHLLLSSTCSTEKVPRDDRLDTTQGGQSRIIVYFVL